MHVLIVTAHPDPNAYSHAAIARFVAGLESVPGSTHEILNLSEEGFDPRFTGADRQSYLAGTEPGADVLTEQQRVDRADVLVVLFPIYWWSMPAIMKGWFDRVFTSGWAFVEDPEKGTQRMLGRLKGRVIAIGGSYRRTYERRGYLEALNTQIVQGIFGYTGMQSLGLDLLLPMDEASAEDGLRQAFEIGRITAQGSD